MHFTPKLSVISLPNFLSATAISPSIYFYTIFLLKNLERVFGILPLMSLLMHLKASAVLLNLWKSYKVILNKLFNTFFSIHRYLRNIVEGFQLFLFFLVCRIWIMQSQQQFRIRLALLLLIIIIKIVITILF